MSYRNRFGLAVALAVLPLAPIAARATPGQVAAAAGPTDASLTDRVSFRLDTSEVLRKYDIKVKVDDGIAMLSGDVATAAQKAEAARLAAQTTGIRRLDNGITVTPDADKTLTERAKAGLSKTGATIDDAWITTKVKWFYVGEEALQGSDIDVDTRNKVVTLTGTVATAAGKARAEALARQTEGVSRVVNHLIVGPKKP